MSFDFQDLVASALQSLPVDLRASALRDIDRLQQAMALSREGIGRLIVNQAADVDLRCIAAWLVGLTRDSSLAEALERQVQEAQPTAFLWETAKALPALDRGSVSFRSLAESRDPEVRRIAAFALGQFRKESDLDLLVRMLEAPSEEPRVRAQAAEALGYLGNRAALPQLLAATEDRSVEVRFWSVFALGQLGEASALPTLENLAQRDHERLEGWWEVSREAAGAMEEIHRRSPQR
jgi:HEAT repeats